jgi:predicted nucleotidyltransferase
MCNQTDYTLTDKMHILSVLKNKLEKAYPNSIESVILFGSQASNTATEFSDYDILIILRTDYSRSDENRILDICFDVDIEYDILIDMHLLSMDELNTKRGRQPIFVNALKNGIYASTR